MKLDASWKLIGGDLQDRSRPYAIKETVGPRPIVDDSCMTIIVVLLHVCDDLFDKTVNETWYIVIQPRWLNKREPGVIYNL